MDYTWRVQTLMIQDYCKGYFAYFALHEEQASWSCILILCECVCVCVTYEAQQGSCVDGLQSFFTLCPKLETGALCYLVAVEGLGGNYSDALFSYLLW